MDFKCENVGKIIEVSNANEAQKYLDLGWVLLERVAYENGPEKHDYLFPWLVTHKW